MPFEPISRRDILKLAIAAPFSGLLKPMSWLEARQAGVLTFAYFSDSHVSLKRNVAECKSMLAEFGTFKPKFAINGGDVVDYGWKGEYDSYDGVLRGLGWKTHHIPGNHDVRWSPLGLKIFNDRVGAPYSAFEAQGVHFFLLDSTVPLSHWGHYESDMLRWLESSLKKIGRDDPVILATHHWVGRDSVMIDNEDKLLKIIEPYNVKIVLTGHGHNDLLWRWDRTLCTMNKGLYQGSYQKLEIDRERNELRLFRRTTENPTLTLLAAEPLKPKESGRPVFALKPGVESVSISGDAKGQFRWNSGAWAPIPDDRIVAIPAMIGQHALDVRRGPNADMTRLELERSDASRVASVQSAQLSGGVMSHVKLVDGRLYVSSMDGAVTCLDSSTLKKIWTAKSNGYCHSSPMVFGDLVVVGSADGHVYGLEVSSGTTRWKVATKGPVYASATMAKGAVITGSGDGTIFALDPKSGVEKWRYALPPSDTAFVQSHLITDGERVFAGAWDKHLYALDAEKGTLVWRFICTASTFAFSPAIGSPALAGGRVVVPANGNELYCFNAADGALVWKASANGDKFGYSGPRIRDGRIYIGCLGGKGQVRCMSLEDGKELWMTETGAEIYDSTPALGDQHLCIGCVNGVTSFICMADGAIQAQYRLPAGHFLSSPAAEGKTFYCATYADQLFAITLR